MELRKMGNRYQGLEKSEVAAWLENPITKRAMEILSERIGDIRGQIVATMEATSIEDDDASIGRTVRYAGAEMYGAKSLRGLIFGEAQSYVG